jgi:hypothetical protein
MMGRSGLDLRVDGCGGLGGLGLAFFFGGGIGVAGYFETLSVRYAIMLSCSEKKFLAENGRERSMTWSKFLLHVEP